ncbi:MAG: hypothetical protein HY718_11750, partial [Planctomycetes bacterium]|nr:hypothetical protein [Planctomycetota bacterium]
AASSTASEDVKESGTSVLAGAATPVAGSVVKPVISDSSISGANLVGVYVSTGGSGSITNLTVVLVFRSV